MSLSNLSQSNINNTMKVKVILGNDIRRWRYSKSESKLSSLNEFVSSSFNLNNFWLQYEDDEGDRLTLSSDNDFEDAFTCALEEDRKSLKIYVIQGSIHNAQRKNSINNNNNNNNPSSSQPNTECFEMKAAAIDFLQNADIVKLLPDLHRRIFEEIKKSKQEFENNDNDKKEDKPTLIKWDSPQSIEKIIRNILENEDKFKPIISHELYNKKLNSMIPHIATRISSHLPILMNFSTEAIAAWIPHLTSVLGHGFSSFGSFSSMDGDMPSTMSSFFPLMCSFMSQHGDYSGLSGFCANDNDQRDSNGNIIHHGVECDGCKTRPIKGSRFKCCICTNYDLCGQCESFNKHDVNHPLLKFNNSAQNAVPPFMGLHEIMHQFGHGPQKWFGHHWKGRFGGNGRRGYCHRNKQQNEQNQGSGPYPHGPPPHHGMGHVPPHHPGWWNQDGDNNWGHRGHRAWKRWNRWNQQQQQQQGQWQQGQWQQQGQQQQPEQQQQQYWQNWCNSRQNNQQNGDNISTISSTINKEDNKEKKIKVMADFVKDVTLPDRTYYPTDTVLTKTWKMKNNGEYEWGNNVELVFFKGNESLTLEKRYPVINAKSGQEVEVSAVIKTPNKPGRYCSYYRLQRNGEYFGPRVWVDIFAVDEEKENTLILNKNIEPKWKKYKNKNKNKGNNNNQRSQSPKDKQQDKMIKLEKKEAKLEAKQLKLEAKQSKLASKLNNVSKQLDQQNENENPTKLVQKQEKLKKQQFKIKKQVDKLKNKTNVCQQQRLNIGDNNNDNNDNNNDNKNKKPVIIDEQQLLDDIANAAVKDLENEFNAEQKQPIQSIQLPLSAISCVCGTTLHKTSPVQAYNHGATVNCDICGKFCPQTAPIYHCPNLKSMAHSEGYDLCCSCVEYQMQGFIGQQIIQQPIISNVHPPIQPIQPIQPQIPIDIVPDVIPPPEPQKKVNKKEEEFIYKQQLEQLRAMGFNDDEKIKAELIQQKGNVQRVANRLLQQ